MEHDTQTSERINTDPQKGIISREEKLIRGAISGVVLFAALHLGSVGIDEHQKLKQIEHLNNKLQNIPILNIDLVKNVNDEIIPAIQLLDDALNAMGSKFVNSPTYPEIKYLSNNYDYNYRVDQLGLEMARAELQETVDSITDGIDAQNVEENAYASLKMFLSFISLVIPTFLALYKGSILNDPEKEHADMLNKLEVEDIANQYNLNIVQAMAVLTHAQAHNISIQEALDNVSIES